MKELSKEELLEWLEHWIRECSRIDYNERKGKPFCPDCPYEASCTKAHSEIKACLEKLIENQPSKEEIFVRHIENHLKGMGIKGKVICKICGKDIDEIYQEARTKEKKMKYTKKEIELCRETAKFYRKSIKLGSWVYWDEEAWLVDGFWLKMRGGKLSIPINIPSEHHVIKDYFPLWTWEDAREWLRRRNWHLFEHGDFYLNKNEVLVRVSPLLDNGKLDYDTSIKEFGKTDLEAILKVVLTVLKRENNERAK